MAEPNSLRNISLLIILFASLVNLFLGGLVLSDSPQRKINRLFVVLSTALGFWGIAFLCMNFTSQTVSGLYWSRVYQACILFVPALFYHIVIGSIGNPFKGTIDIVEPAFERVKQLAYVFSAGWFILTVGGFFPQELMLRSSFYLPQINAQFWTAFFVYASLITLSIVILARATVIVKDPNQKSRLVYMLLVGALALLAAGMGAFFLTEAPWMSFSWVIPFVHLAATLCLMIIAYAFTTTQLYQFAELVRKVLAVATMTAVLLSVFGTTHLLAQKFLVPYIPRSDFFALAMASIIMSFLFHPLRFRVQNLVDRVFFTERYDQMQRLRDLSRQVLSSADREELMETLFMKLGEIGFSSISILLKDPQKSVFQIKRIIGGGNGSDGFFLKPDSLLVQYLREEKKELIRDEVSRRILADWERQALVDEMDILQAEIAFPLFSTRRRSLFGIITLGNSDLGYSSYMGRNVFWLKSVIDNAGIMFDNFYHHDFANALIPYVGRTWADEMRRNKEGFRERLTGHRTWVSVLMVDIRHFTTMSARMDPTEVVALLKEFRLAVAPVVYRYQGAIDKFIGDAVMIVFGLPILHTLPNPDRNAVECAHAIMQEIAKLNETKLKTNPISIGIGVSSGEVIAGNVDSGDRVEYTVIGDAANMVARLEDLAKDNVILMSPGTYGRVKDFVHVNVWPPQKLTGFEEPVPVYELNGIKKPGALILPATPPANASADDYGPMAANQ